MKVAKKRLEQEDDDDDDNEMEQIRKKTKKCRIEEDEDDEYGQLGIIESVSLRNFMCHDNLTFEFDPHMNFIIGRNGSGKSAVITGIILGLGGKSSATGRFGNIQSFVKSGKSSASIYITLKNCGENAYKPEEYGQKIIIERHFTKDGSNSYKIKSQAGHILSTSKEELKNILTIMDIQIENPITVLTQETSKNFLISKNAKGNKLFELFFKGTGLASSRENYLKSQKEANEMKEEINKKRSILPEIEKDVKKLKTLIDKSSKVKDLNKELLWAIAIELEQRKEDAKENFEKVDKKMTDLKSKLSKIERDSAKFKQDVDVFKKEESDAQDKLTAIRRELNELSAKKEALRRDIRIIEGTCSSFERQLQKVIEEIESYESIINDIKTKKNSNLNEDKRKREMIINNLKNSIGNVVSEIRKLEQHKTSSLEAEYTIQNKKDQIHAEIQEIEYARDNVIRDKQQLINGMKNKIDVYGREMSNVLQSIQKAVRAKLFKVEPKGPIGLYINVKQPEWAFAVQECLQTGFLKTFLCDNHADAEKLTSIFKANFQHNRPSIITTKFVSEVYDVSANKTVCDHPTLLDMLDISDPVVTNCLIDQKEIENILLIADEKVARKLMLYNPPRKCKLAYTPNGDQYCHSPYRNYSCKSMNQICMLKTVNEEDIRMKDEQLKQLDALKLDKHNKEERLLQQMNENMHEISRISKEITDLKIKYKDLQAKLKAEEEIAFEEPKDFDGLQKDLEKYHKEKDHLEEQYNSEKDTMDSKNEELNTLENDAKEASRVLQSESQKLNSLTEKVCDYEHKIERYDMAIDRLKKQISDFVPILEEQKQDFENAEATAVTAVAHAQSVSENRIETRRSSETIRQILKETEKFIKEQKNFNKEVLTKEYIEKKETLKKNEAMLQKLEKTNKHLNEMLLERFRTFKQVCNSTSIMLTCKFTTLLGENNFDGRPRFNFEDETLEIYAKPKKARTKLEDSNLTQLSGGERSYVTISFLLSLWSLINSPFRILDEYDVFMDANNRHFSINLLVNTAKSNKKIQYIFLSPLEMPEIADSDHVKVHKMPSKRK